MKMAINAQLLSADKEIRNTGLSQYIYKLLFAYAELGLGDLNVFVKKDSSIIDNFKCLETLFSSSNRELRIAWEQLVLPLLLKKYKIDLIHCPVNIMPLMAGCKSVVTVHDLSFIRLKKSHGKLQTWYLKNFTKLSCRKADKIIAVSESTKNDIVNCYGIDAGKIRVIYNGISDDFKVIEDIELQNVIRQKYDLPDKYILYVGTLEPRKNIPGLLKAFSMCLDKLPGYKLVIAGSKGWDYENIFTRIKELDLEERVVFAGYVENKHLPLMYNMARLFVYASFYEGFGLPLIESMACGTPVITSNISSLEEVSGDAALIVDPNKPAEIASAMTKVLLDSKVYEDMRSRGFKRAKDFSWKKTAQETWEVYKEVLGL
jgi:glycosyltransferase involved in cell wall biosynthesis